MLFAPERSVLTGNPSTAWQYLRLRPHGSSLLTSGASFWLSAARVLVLTMAGVEAVAWGYLGFLFGETWDRWLIAALVGAVIFLVVWIIDSSLLTYDRAADEHAARIFGETAGPRSRTLRLGFAIVTRILIVAASLTITAPYLSQIIFHKEIQQSIEAEAVGNIDGARDALARSYADRLGEIERQIGEKQAQLEKEIGGTGVSGRYGIGPVAESMQKAIESLRAEATRLGEEKERSLSEFEGLAADWKANRDLISSKYAVVLPSQTILSNRKALQELESKPEYRQTQLAVKAFLAFIFIGMLLLKLFEPRSVRFYLSDVMQGEYSRYLSGAFDPLLPPLERSTRDPQAMTPERLFDFLAKVWRPQHEIEASETSTRARKAAAFEDVVTLQTLMERLEPMVERARAQVGESQAQFEDAHQRYLQLMSAIDIVQGHVTAFQSEAENLGTLDAKGRAEYGTEVRGNLWKAEQKLRELKHTEKLEMQKLARTKEALKAAEEKLARRNGEIEEIEERIRQAHLLSLHDSGGPATASN